jgi:pimeloyl-ACP methyl ester carboxylesterase
LNSPKTVLVREDVMTESNVARATTGNITVGAFLIATAAAILICTGSASRADPYPPVDQGRPPIVLRSHGVFWAGGKVVKRTQTGTEKAGDRKDLPFTEQDVSVGQAYVEYFIPQRLRAGKATIPIVLIPGGTLIGAQFLTTPDGREGWADYFIRRGFPVYIVDPPGRGRAGFSPDAFNNVRAGAAPPSTQPRIDVWDSSGWLEWNAGPLPAPSHGPHDPSCIGNDARDPNAPPVYCNGDLMPALDPEGYKHWLGALAPEVPVEGGLEPGIIAALEKIGPAIYIGHSAGGTMGGHIANQRPELFKAVIGIEPQGDCMLPPSEPIKGLGKVPTFSIHGINQVGRPDTGPCLDTYKKIADAGGDATYLSLPKLPHTPLFDRIPQKDIWGNDHIMMWDTNSDEIAGILLEWIVRHAEKSKRR